MGSAGMGEVIISVVGCDAIDSKAEWSVWRGAPAESMEEEVKISVGAQAIGLDRGGESKGLNEGEGASGLTGEGGTIISVAGIGAMDSPTGVDTAGLAGGDVTVSTGGGGAGEATGSVAGGGFGTVNGSRRGLGGVTGSNCVEELSGEGEGDFARFGAEGSLMRLMTFSESLMPFTIVTLSFSSDSNETRRVLLLAPISDRTERQQQQRCYRPVSSSIPKPFT